jgi:dihydrofolate reductase
MGRNRVIGRGNALPWHLPADLQHFKRTTMGKPIIMGRKTCESIGRPLPGRLNIVVSRNPAYSAQGFRTATTLDEALAIAAPAEESMVIGGAQLYAAALLLVTRMYLTLIDADFEGDVHFPPYDKSHWRETAREPHEPDERNPYPYSYVTLERIF